MQKLIEVPHLAQYNDLADDYWQGRSCGIVSLAMVLGYYGIELVLADLIKRGAEIDHYDPKIGWKHQTIVDLAQEYGLQARRTENETLENLLVALDNDLPVIVSIYKNWDPNSSGHLVVLNGYLKHGDEIDGFYVNDPVGASYKHKNQFVPLAKFIRGWKERAIYVKKG